MAEFTDQNSYILARLSNFQGSPEGALLPPTQRGESRIPYVSNLKIIRNVPGNSGPAITLTWDNTDSNPAVRIDHYNIYYTLPNGNVRQQVGPFIARESPAQISIVTQITTPVTFAVQTVLANGMMTRVENSPTVSAVAEAPVIDGGTISPGTIQEVSLAFPLLTGMQIQPIATVAGIALNVTTDNLILSTTGDGTHTGGGLLTVAIRRSAASAGGASTAIKLKFEVDGIPATTLTLYDTATDTFNVDTSTISNVVFGDGSNVGDYISFLLNIGFNQSLDVYLSTITSTNLGEFDVSILYCTKTT